MVEQGLNITSKGGMWTNPWLAAGSMGLQTLGKLFRGKSDYERLMEDAQRWKLGERKGLYGRFMKQLQAGTVMGPARKSMLMARHRQRIAPGMQRMVGKYSRVGSLSSPEIQRMLAKTMGQQMGGYGMRLEEMDLQQMQAIRQMMSGMVS